MTKKDLTHIEQLIADADVSNDYSVALNQLKDWDEKYGDDFLLNYYKGLICYLDPDTEEFRLKWAKDFFKKALNQEPTHLMSQIFLAYTYFDLENYKSALQHFQQVLGNSKNWDVLKKNQQVWRLCQMAELITVCCLKLNTLSKYKKYYQAWKDLFYQFSRREDFYFPKDLVMETATFLKHRGEELDDNHTTFFRGLSLDLIGIIKAGDGFEKIYSKELDQLKNWSGQKSQRLIKVFS